MFLSLQRSTLSEASTLLPTYSLASDEGGERFGQSLALGRTIGPGTLAVGAPGAAPGRREGSGRVYLWRASKGGAELLQTLNGEAEDEALGSSVFATGRYRVFDELFLSTPRSQHSPLRRAKGRFDEEALDYRVVLQTVPGSRRPSAFARGDFDGNGALDLAVGVPDESGSPRAPTGGFFDVLRRTDTGEWAEWGRYRQGD